MGSVIHEWRPDEIFVFGSNLAGVHGAGAARFALEHCGAVFTNGIGLQGQSYAIPTKDYNIQTLDLDTIREYAKEFCEYTRRHPEKKFFLTRVGCGLAGYTDDQIAPLFVDINTENTRYPPEWEAELYSYWYMDQ